ncbi:hypothetical protein WKI40_14690 [Kosakonia sacchari]|uniref:hypothetical protein n=1 Tax=Kosakonia sacchari TaxID=1158459 RepID=UPI0030BE3E7D
MSFIVKYLVAIISPLLAATGYLNLYAYDEQPSLAPSLHFKQISGSLVAGATSFMLGAGTRIGIGTHCRRDSSSSFASSSDLLPENSASLN